jgi:hypothetical protein
MTDEHLDHIVVKAMRAAHKTREPVNAMPISTIARLMVATIPELAGDEPLRVGLSLARCRASIRG